MDTQKNKRTSEDRPKPDANQKVKSASEVDRKGTKDKISTKEAKFENPKDDPA